VLYAGRLLISLTPYGFSVGVADVIPFLLKSKQFASETETPVVSSVYNGISEYGMFPVSECTYECFPMNGAAARPECTKYSKATVNWVVLEGAYWVLFSDDRFRYRRAR
jgi:hypothetical protein